MTIKVNDLVYNGEYAKVAGFKCPAAHRTETGIMLPVLCREFRNQSEMPPECQQCVLEGKHFEYLKTSQLKWMDYLENLLIDIKEYYEEDIARLKKHPLINDVRLYRITFITPILGTAPTDKELYTRFVIAKYLKENKDLPEEEKQRIIEQELQDIPETPKEERDLNTTGFRRDAKGLYIPAYTFKGFLKEAATALKDILKIPALKKAITNYVFIAPEKIYLSKAPTGYVERPLRAQTPQGERVCLARSEAVENAKCVIAIGIIPNSKINFDVIEKLLSYGSLKGLGQWRNGGWGKFVFSKAQ